MDWPLFLFTLRRRALSRRGGVIAGAALVLIGGSVVGPAELGQRQACELTVSMRDPAAVLELQVYAEPRWSPTPHAGGSQPVAHAFLPSSQRAVFPLRCGQ